MLGLFLETVGMSDVPAGILALILPFIVLSIVVGIGIYIYTALALMRIAKKTGTEPAWLAWIPVANLYLMSKIAKMHWWPILLVIGFVIPFINFIAMIVLVVFALIWWWKIFEAVGKPGWWALLSLIPIVGHVIFLVLLGIAAWGSSSQVVSGVGAREVSKVVKKK